MRSAALDPIPVPTGCAPCLTHVIACFTTALLLTTLPAHTGLAQARPDKIPKRPHLAAGQDSNSAVAYYSDGMEYIDRDPERAAASFYWASRFDPSWAAPYYGEYAALLLCEPPQNLNAYLTDQRWALQNQHLLHIDSLAWLAALKNPFVDRRLEGSVLGTWLRRRGDGDETLRILAGQNPGLAGWVAYARGNFRRSIALYTDAIKAHPDEPGLQIWRARAFFSIGQNDSALAAVRHALEYQRGVESDIGEGWVSHAFLEYSVGFLFALAEQPDSARAAYERALLDDLTFHPAHRQMAQVRLVAHDSAGALDELAQAVSLAPNEAGYLYDFGVLLLVSGHSDSAVNVLKRAIVAEPFFASPHYPLGVMYAKSGFAKEAAEHLNAFIRLAPASLAPTINAARVRLAALQADSTQP